MTIFFGNPRQGDENQALCFLQRFQTREEAKKIIFDYIELFYNRQRKHSYLSYKSPVEYEMLARVT